MTDEELDNFKKPILHESESFIPSRLNTKSHNKFDYFTKKTELRSNKSGFSMKMPKNSDIQVYSMNLNKNFLQEPVELRTIPLDSFTYELSRKYEAQRKAVVSAQVGRIKTRERAARYLDTEESPRNRLNVKKSAENFVPRRT